MLLCPCPLLWHLCVALSVRSGCVVGVKGETRPGNPDSKHVKDDEVATKEECLSESQAPEKIVAMEVKVEQHLHIFGKLSLPFFLRFYSSLAFSAQMHSPL